MMKISPHLRSRAKAKGGFGTVLLAAFMYLVDCAMKHGTHPDVAWIQSGVYAFGPFGFWFATLPLAIIGLGYGTYYGIKSIFEHQ